MTRLPQCFLFVGAALLAACAAGDPNHNHSPRAQPLAQSMTPDRQVSINWSEVPALLRSGRVEAIVQLHDLTVTLTTMDGGKFITREPSLDAILAAIREHAPNADSIVQATE